MKRILTTIAFFCLFSTTFAQTIVNEHFYSHELKDTIRYRVWLPDGYDATKIYPVFYTVEDTGDGLLAGAANFYKNAGLIPNVIVVGIINGRGLINYNFETGLLDERGPEFLKNLSADIMPHVEKQYHTSKFKVFLGHSYSSTYANYLLLHQPGMFSAYILFAPERWWQDEALPRFELNADILKYYNSHPTFYYLASGSFDIQRRRNYAGEINDKLKKLDSTQFFFRYSNVPGSDHMTVVANGMGDALIHVFKPYYEYSTVDKVADPLAFFNKTKAQLNDYYGIALEKNNRNIALFANLASASYDQKAMTAFADYFIDDDTKGLDLCNFAYSCLSMGYTSKAIELYKRCIAKSEKDELKTPQGRANLIMAYRNLSYRAYKDDNAEAWQVLQKAIDDKNVKDSLLMHFYIGKLAVDRSYRLQIGLQHLLKYSKTDINSGKNWGVTPEVVYLNIAKCYLLLNDKSNAKIYLQKTLAEGQDNKEAKDLLLKI